MKTRSRWDEKLAGVVVGSVFEGLSAKDAHAHWYNLRTRGFISRTEKQADKTLTVTIFDKRRRPPKKTKFRAALAKTNGHAEPAVKKTSPMVIELPESMYQAVVQLAAEKIVERVRMS